MRDAAEVRARVAGAARGRAEVRTPSPSSLSMVSGRSVLSHELQGKDRATRVSVANEASRWNIAAKCSGVLHVHVVMVKLLFAVTILGSILSFHKNRMSAFPLSWLLM